MAARDDRPNILLILTDQHRYDTLGCYGAEMCQTPNLDRLAQRGVRFDRAYTMANPCSPSRAALFTGLYPHKSHVRVNDEVVNPEAETLASALRGAGYRLGYAGKWHVDRARMPSDCGFAGKDFPGYGYPIYKGLVDGMRFGPTAAGGTRHYERYLQERGLEVPRVLEAHYGDNPGVRGQEMYALHSGPVESSFEYMVSEDTIELLRAFAARGEEDGSPFLVWTNFWGPHTPCLLPEPYYSMYDPEAIPEEPSFGETWERKPFVQQLVERHWGLSAGGWRRWREIVARYWGYVTMLDHLVGRILAALEELGLAENTIVVFGTDHGDNMGAHRLIEKGPFAYEQCYRLPMIAAHPQCATPGSACDEFVYLQDLFPTFLEAGGCALPEAPDTTSLLGLFRGEDVTIGRDSVYAQFYAQLFPSEQRILRTRRHKLVYSRSDMGELYDLVEDPWEMRNLIDLPETQALQAELMDRMREHMVRLDDPILGPFDRIRAVY
jgi:arylsulfatase A-like enzyme